MNMFHGGLKCAIEGVTFQDDGIVILKLSRGQCTDMRGAIEFVHQLIKQMLDYKLGAIVCESEDEPTYAYMPVKDYDDDGSSVWFGRPWVCREERESHRAGRK